MSAADAIIINITEIRYGIWFTEGTETVQRFRESIVR